MPQKILVRRIEGEKHSKYQRYGQREAKMIKDHRENRKRQRMHWLVPMN
jgi:hypothetical protein